MKAIIDFFNNLASSITFASADEHNFNSANSDIPESATKYIF